MTLNNALDRIALYDRYLEAASSLRVSDHVKAAKSAKSVSIFSILFFQIILFALPTASQQERVRAAYVDWDDFFRKEVPIGLFDYRITQPTKQCSEIRYIYESMPFLIIPCFDKSSKELEVTLKVGDVDLGQAKGVAGTELSISFDEGRLLKGEHRYYVKGNRLWLHYNNIIFGKEREGNKELVSVPSGFITSDDGSKPETKEGASKSKPGSKGKPKKDAAIKDDAPKPKPKKNAPKLKSKPDL